VRAIARLLDRTLRAIGRYAEARQLAQATLDRDRRILGEDHPDTLISVTSTQLRPDLARAHLLYGEWLRRKRRRIDPREQLRTAHDLLESTGMEAFAKRARRELMATGGKVRKRSDETRDELTPQEEQIARLARDRLSNPEIGAQLFISARTVEWHLRKVFAKLGIASRIGLHTTLVTHEPKATSP
jgi:ATP/maltotriose-dependent transcriptional regulator MalT